MAEKQIPLSPEETIAVLNQKAKADGDDFLIRVQRRKSHGSLPEMACSLSGAQVIHAASPETWLPVLAGGGPMYMLQMYHSKEPTVPVGSMLHFTVPVDARNPPKSPSEIDSSVIRRGDWNGPAALTWPLPEDKSSVQTSAYSIPSTSPSSPVPPYLPGSAPQSQVVPGGGQPGASFAAQESANAAFLRSIEQERHKLERAQAELADEKRRMELDALRRENEARIKELEAKVLSAVQAQHREVPPAPKMDIVQLLAAATPVLTAFLHSQNEMRLAMMKQQETAQLAMMKQQETAQAQQQTVITAMLSRPSVDPVMERAMDKIQQVVERSQQTQVPQSTMLHQMGETMATIANLSMDLAHTAADLNVNGGKQEEPVAMKAIREATKAIGAIFQGYQQTALNKPAAPNPAQLAYEQQVRALQQRQQAQQVPVPVPQAPQAPTIPAPPSLQIVPPAAQVLHQAVMPAVQEQTILERLEAMIKAQVPANEVILLFINALKARDRDLELALDAVGGDPNELFVQRLGPYFMSHPELTPYVVALMSEVQRQGPEAGLFDDPEDDDEGGDDEGEDEGEEEVEEATA